MPVLVRWFENVDPPVAECLIVIIYSYEQLAKRPDRLRGIGGVYTAESVETSMETITMI
ncbi:hypothetical protein [Lysobacter enzymogenes]|uniref:hypothetical protein n=1 Tax=Lysobacter enzymogenes TaxID=69 RepID=UPI0031B5CC0E